MARDYSDVLNSLLNKAERTESEHEREAILGKVAELMAKHAIDEAMLTAARREAGEKVAANDELIRVTIRYEGQYAMALQYWTSTIGACFSCETLWSSDKRSRTNRTTFLHGHRSDVEQVQHLIDSLRVQMIRPLKAYQKEQSGRDYPTTVAAFIERRDFVMGFARGAAEKIKGETSRLLTSGETGPGTALVLRDRGEVVKSYVAKYSSGKSSGRGISGGWGDGSRRGAEAGRNADVSLGKNRKAVTS